MVFGVGLTFKDHDNSLFPSVSVRCFNNNDGVWKLTSLDFILNIVTIIRVKDVEINVVKWEKISGSVVGRCFPGFDSIFSNWSDQCLTVISFFDFEFPVFKNFIVTNDFYCMFYNKSQPRIRFMIAQLLQQSLHMEKLR